MRVLDVLRSELPLRAMLFAVVAVGTIIAMGVDRGFRSAPAPSPPPLTPQMLPHTTGSIGVPPR